MRMKPRRQFRRVPDVSKAVVLEQLEPRQLLTAQLLSLSPDNGFSDNDRITNVAPAQFAGSADLGSAVQVGVFADSQFHMIASGVIDSGQWVANATTTLSEGDHSLWVRELDPSGSVLTTSGPFALSLDFSVPAAPVLAPIKRLPGAVREFDFQISGTAEPGSLVAVFQTGVGVTGRALADSDGRWSLTGDNCSLSDARFEFFASTLDPAGNRSDASSSFRFQPNIVLIYADDMRADDLGWMPFVSTTFAEQGTVFNNAFAPTALCGPSRATLMTGLFAERTGIHENQSPLGGSANLDLSSSLPVWLNNSGYQTGLFGKDRTLPGRDKEIPSQATLPIPPGWDEYFGFLGGVAGFGYTVDHNGVPEKYGLNESDYTTDVMYRQVSEFVADSVANEAPFFAFLAPFAPHYPFTPAPRHVGYYDDIEPYHPASYNIPEPGARTFDEAAYPSLDESRRHALESLLAVDEAVQNLTVQLSESGFLDNTIIIFSSDHGILRAEHALADKRVFYEEAIRIPLVIWDGRAPGHSASDSLVVNADISATIAWMAGAESPPNLDGRNLTPLMESTTASVRDDILIHHWKVNLNPPSTVEEWGVRNEQWVYASRSNGKVFLFDVINDPLQLDNLAGDPSVSALESALAARLDQLKPADRTSPSATQLQAFAGPTESGGLPMIRIQARVSDLGTGGSQIRTPEIVFNVATPIGLGITMDALDGRFDNATEDVFIDIPWGTFVTAGSPETVYVRARDLPGNWSTPYPVAVPLLPSPHLDAASDTGSLNSDGVTLDATPLFRDDGSSPGSTITLFAVPRIPGVLEPLRLGTTTSSSSGTWEITGTFILPGEWHIVGTETTAADPSSTRLMKPLKFHLFAAMQTDASMLVYGTSSDDWMHISGNQGEALNFRLNDVSVGSLPGTTRMVIIGWDGNDRIQVDGTVNSVLNGFTGNDVLIGGAGNDTLIGSSGFNELSGRQGNDNYVFNDVGIPNYSIHDVVSEETNQGFDTLSFVHPFGILAELAPGAADPIIVMKSPYNGQRRVRFLTPETLAQIERITGSDADDTIRVGQQMSVQSRAGHDVIQITQPLVPGQVLYVRQLTAGIRASTTAEIRAEVLASVGTLSLNRAVPSDIVFVQVSSNEISLQGPLASVNSFLLSVAIKWTTPTDFSGKGQLTLTSYDTAVPATVEQSKLFIDISFRPGLITGGTANWTENQAPVVLAPAAWMADQDGNMAGGRLDIASSQILDSSDRLVILPLESGTDRVTLQNNLVLFQGITVGTWTWISEQQLLSISFTSNATIPSVRAILRRIAFYNSSEDPKQQQRQIRFQLFDGAGVASVVATTTVTVTAVNDGPAAIELQNQIAGVGEDLDTSVRFRLADIVVTDDSQGTNTLSISGPDAGAFEIVQSRLYLKSGVTLNAQTKPRFAASVRVMDTSVSGDSGVTVEYSLQVTTTVPVLKSPAGATQSLRPEFSWNLISGAVSYDIWIRNATTGQNPYQLASSTSISWTPPVNLEIGRFNVWVRSVNARGRRSAWSVPLTFSIVTPVTLNPVALRQLTSRPTLTWQALPGAVHYDLWINNTLTGQTQVVREPALSTTSWSASADLPMGTYRAWVRGVDAEGIARTWSSPAGFLIVPVPSLISPLDATFDRTPEFLWTAVAGAAQYEILVRNPNTGSTEFQSMVTTNAFTVPRALLDGPYLWRVRAIGPQAQSSDFSPPNRVYVGGQPKILAPLGGASTTPEFLWSAVQDAVSYQLRVDRTDQFQPNLINVSGLTTNRYVPSAPLAAGTYRFWVRAVSSTGETSIWSSVALLTVAASETSETLFPQLLHEGSQLLLDTRSTEVMLTIAELSKGKQSSASAIQIRESRDESRDEPRASDDGNAARMETSRSRALPGRLRPSVPGTQRPADVPIEDFYALELNAIDWLMTALNDGSSVEFEL
jgi:arylsulfatase A-like enzyme/Ca2+-binding RTX toxin-like protein